MDNPLYSLMDTPGTFRVRVHGRPSDDWVRAMWSEVETETTMSDEGDETAVTAHLPDQAALIGLINALYNMGYAVLSVDRVTGPQGDAA